MKVDFRKTQNENFRPTVNPVRQMAHRASRQHNVTVQNRRADRCHSGPR